MSKKILIVVDMQKDFIYGSLGSPEAREIVSNVVAKIKQYKNEGNMIIATQDTHFSDYLSTEEGRKLPIPHCIVNSEGWQIEDGVFDAIRGYDNLMCVNKTTFGSVAMCEKLRELIAVDEQSEYSIEIIGLVLNICVISNALLVKGYFPEAEISIDLNCTAATSKDDYESACMVLKSCQVDIHG